MSVEIRPARLDELTELPAVELSAAERFRGSSQDAIADDGVTPLEVYVPLQTDGLVLLALVDGRIAGFAACQACEDALHLWELAVRRDHQGRGLGRALLDAAAEIAQRRGLPAMTLSTFRDIPWNGPFYRWLGFVELSELNRRLAAIMEREVALGLDVAQRCVMRLAV
jgi:ribosomal protein S18 acetylase RimI-like enzyme